MSASSCSDDSDEEKPLSKKSKKTKTDQSMVRMVAPLRQIPQFKLKVKTKKDALEAESTGIKIFSTNDGDKYIDLGKKKRATVRAFRGTILLDIREFYEAGGQEKPGKKGITLTIEQVRTSTSILPLHSDLIYSVGKIEAGYERG